MKPVTAPCPSCGEIVIGNICPYCRYAMPRGFSLWTGEGGGGVTRPVTPTGPLVVTQLGATVDTSSSLTVTVPNITAYPGDVLIVTGLTSGFTQQGDDYLRDDITWGAISGVGGGAGQFAAAELHTTAATNTTISVDMTFNTLAAAATADVVVTWSPFDSNAVVKIVSVSKITGLDHPSTASNSFWYFLNQSNTEGNDTNPIATPVLMRRDHSAIYAPLGIVGNSGHTVGTWGGGFASLDRQSTNLGTSDDRILDVGYKINTSINTYTASQTGMTSAPWLIVPTIFDRP